MIQKQNVHYFVVLATNMDKHHWHTTHWTMEELDFIIEIKTAIGKNDDSE